MKSEAVLQVNSETQNSDNHSDTSSQMSDEGYRSMGLTQDKNKKRSSVYSQNSGEDIEENGKWIKLKLDCEDINLFLIVENQKIYTEDELNDMGLRKTNFSQRIYDGELKFTRKTPEPSRSVPQSPVEDDEEKCLLNNQRPSQNLGKSV